MDHIPKLFPNWTDISFLDVIHTKLYSRYNYIKPPDYGGAGIDVNFSPDGQQCESVKSNGNLTNFAAEKCSLPFLPINLNMVVDSCTEPVLEDKREYMQFCLKLNAARNKMGKKNDVIKISTVKALETSIAKIRKSVSHDPELTLMVPNPIKKLTERLPKRIIVPNFNVDYIGGNLAVVKTNSYYLLHPFSEDQNKLCVTPLKYENDMHFKPVLSKQKMLNSTTDRILQIESSNHECCVMRSKSSYFLLNLNKLELYSQSVQDCKLLYVASNPYNPLEVLSVYDRGKLKLRNMEFKTNVWSTRGYESPDPGFLYPTWRCDFGSHPFSTLSMNERYLYAFDLRDGGKPRDLFSTKNASFHFEEELTAMKRWNRNPFQHFLASTDHFVICDERYPKKSVLLWTHALNNYPVFCDVADLQNSMKSVVIIGTQESQKVHAFFLEHSETTVTPVALGRPLELSSPSDCVDSLRCHAYVLNNRLSRQLAYPLTGVCVEPHLKRTGFTVFQVTSAGDVFHQDFKETISDPVERTYRVTTGCTLTPPEKILPLLETSVGEDALETEVWDAKVSTQIDANVYNILNVPKGISSDCSLCRYDAPADQELVASDLCPGCNLDAAQSSYFSNALSNLSTMIGPGSTEASSLEPDFDYLSRFEDKYSKRMLSLWMDNEQNGEAENPETAPMEVDSSSAQNYHGVSYYSSFQNESISSLANSSTQADSLFDNTYAGESQDIDFVPPSQEIRPLVGETIFLTPKSKKHLLNRNRHSSQAGF